MPTSLDDGSEVPKSAAETEPSLLCSFDWPEVSTEELRKAAGRTGVKTAMEADELDTKVELGMGVGSCECVDGTCCLSLTGGSTVTKFAEQVDDGPSQVISS